MSSDGIFILGLHRSGTTMLANILLAQNEVVGAEHKKHYGVYESNYFSRIFGRYGDLTLKNNYLEFISVMSNYDYFRLLGFDLNTLLRIKAKNYVDFFKKTHELYASKKKAKYWLEKSPSHSYFLDRLIDYFPEAKFLWIRRCYFASLLSAYNLKFDKKQKFTTDLIFITRHIINSCFGEKILNRYKDKMLVLNYENLIDKNNIQEIKRIENYLDIEIDFSFLNKYEKNTSYSTIMRKIVLSYKWKKYICILHNACKCLPFCILKRVKNFYAKKYKTFLPDYSFSLFDENLPIIKYY